MAPFPAADRDLGHPPVPPERANAAQTIADMLEPGMRIAITTHVNADGDGTGSEVALWHVLNDRGLRPAITNPTPFPGRFQFLLEECPQADKSSAAVRYLQRADAIIVVDISDLDRLGHLGRCIADPGVPVVCIDHHLSNGSLPKGPRMIDSTACATGELIHDLFRTAGWPLTPPVAQALYVAILTDTGGFRFSNTTPRALHVAAELLSADVDPESIYRAVYASNPEGRIRMIGEVVDTLIVEQELGLAWMTVPPGALERHGLDPDQLEGIVEFPRSIYGIRLALLFRMLANDRVKVSFRSVGDVNVAELAERFGGGGHRKAAGASLAGSMADVQAHVLAAAREILGGGASDESSSLGTPKSA